MYFSIQKNKQIWVFYIIFHSNYFQAIQTAVFYKKNASKMFKRNLFMFLDLQVSKYQNKNESWGKIYCWKVASENW